MHLALQFPHQGCIFWCYSLLLASFSLYTIGEGFQKGVGWEVFQDFGRIYTPGPHRDDEETFSTEETSEDVLYKTLTLL